MEELRSRARALKRETLALYLAFRDPRTPCYARLWALIVLAYALSPIDLIPDFVPVLGYLDDLILIPLGIALALRMIPPGVMDDARIAASEAGGRLAGRLRWAGAALIILIWIAAIAWIVRLLTPLLASWVRPP